MGGSSISSDLSGRPVALLCSSESDWRRFSLAEQTGARPGEIVMIGDSIVDVMTARNAGAWSLGCAFGFGPRNIMEIPSDTLVSSAADWVTVLMPVSFLNSERRLTRRL